MDKYSRMKSLVHDIPSGWKTIFFFLIILAILIVPMSQSWIFVGIIFLLVFILIVSRIPILFVVKRILLLEPFVFCMAVLTLIQPNGGAIFERIVIKSSMSLFCVILFSNTTQFSEILDVLKKIKTPEIIVTTLALFYRYIFVLVDESERMNRARQNRTFIRKKLSLWFLSATVISQLFLRTSERAERIYAAMCARGWK